MASRSRVAAATISLVALLAMSAGAQETVNQASLSGRVTDPQDAVVPGALVIARHDSTGVAAEATTDRDGRFRFPYLRVGDYVVTVRVGGFAETTRRLTLTAGGAFDLPLPLGLDRLDTAIEVRGAVTVLEAARSQVAATLEAGEVRALPMNGRQFLDLALLVPGVSPPNISATQLFPETSAVPGVGLSVASQRNFSNNFVIDGLSANDDAAGLSGIPLGVDAVDQFQVITSGAQAELGRAIGGYINVVTRSGTNIARGEAYGYFRDDSLNARNALSGTRLPMSQAQYGGSVGGPIRKNRSFFFANAEQRRLDQTGLATIAPASVDVINAHLATVGYPGATVATGEYANPVHSVHALAKLDHRISGADQLSLRYSAYDVWSERSRGAGGLNAPSASAGLDNRDQVIAAGNTLTLSSRMVNETRGQVGWSDLRALPTDALGPTVSIAGVASFGTLSSSPQGRANTTYQIVDNLSYVAGAHALRTGVDLLYNHDTITFPRSLRGAYTFGSLASFLAGSYNNSGFTQTFGAVDVEQNNPNAGVYVQDEWRIAGGVTLNLGVRYDLQFLDTIDTDTDNLSPRAGFAWVPSESRRTVIRGNAGVFYDRVPLRALANALLSAGNTTDLGNLRQINVSLSPTQAGAPVFPGVLSAVVPTATPVNLTTMDRRLQNARSRQASVEVEQQLGDRLTVSAAYQYLKGDALIAQINQNVPTCVAAGANNGCRPIAAYANNNRYSSAAESNYHGLHLSLVQRPVAWGNVRVSYTLSKSMNNVGETFFSSPIDPTDLSKDWGRSDDDQRHRLVATGSVQVPEAPGSAPWRRLAAGVQASATAQYYSALPLNITSGVTTVQGTAGRPLVDGQFIVRNAGTGSDFFSLGARLGRSFALRGGARLEGLVEVFNLTNRRNVLARNANFGAGAYPANPSPTFGQVTAVGEPRTLQLAVRASF